MSINYRKLSERANVISLHKIEGCLNVCQVLEEGVG